MSTEVTDRGANYQSTASTTNTVAAFTPGANRLLLCFVSTVDAIDITAISGHGTWSFITETSTTADNERAELWGCITGASPSSAAVVVTQGSGTSVAAVVELSADYSDTTVAASIVQSVTDSIYSNSGASPYGVTLASFADATNNLTLLCGAHLNSGTSTWTASSPLTEDIQSSNTNNDVIICSDVGEDTTPSAANSDTYAFWEMVGVEIAYQGGGGGGSSHTIIVPVGPVR